MSAVYWVATHVNIANGQTTSSEADLRGLRLIGIGFPATMTSATVTFTGAERSGNDVGPPVPVFNALKFDPGTGTATAISVATGSGGQTVFLNTAGLVANCVLKVVAAGAEGAARDIILYVAPF